jgi:hypothetical protein
MRRLSRVVPLLLVAPVAACGSGSSSVTPAGPTNSPPSGVASSTAQPFVAHRAHVSVEKWRLPVASGRQALVMTGQGRAVLAGGLVAGDQSTAQAFRVDLTHGAITAMPSLGVPVHDTAAGLVGGVPTVVGGGNATEQSVVQAFRGGAWSVVGNLPSTRSDLSVVQDGSRALVVGGYDGVNVPTSILALRPDGTSRVAGNLAQGVRYAATAVVGGHAFVFGGEVLGRELDAVQEVDLATGRTRVIGRLPVPLGHAMAAYVGGGRILLMGGRVTPDRQTDAMWWYDPGTGHFTRAGRLPTVLSDAAVATYGHRIWLLGGESPLVTDRVVSVNVS